MSWWQKKLLRYGLRYGLARTGLLEDEALDVDQLDITIGKRNVIELKDVGLNIKRISKLAQLPASLRLETARVLLLRLVIPADFYQSSIVVEVEGVDIVVKLEDESPIPQPSELKRRARSPTVSRTPQHRKTNRRIPSPSPLNPARASDPDEGDDDAETLRLPTTQEVARSFLRDEPLQERREMEATVAAAASPKSLAESFVSDSSADGDDLGTGTAIGLPGFLAGFLQGIVDRFTLKITTLQIRLEAGISPDTQDRVPLTLRLLVEAVDLVPAQGLQDSDATDRSRTNRNITFHGISIALLSDAEVLADLSELPPQFSHTSSKSAVPSSRSSQALSTSEQADIEPGIMDTPIRSSSQMPDRAYSGAGTLPSDHISSPSLPPSPSHTLPLMRDSITPIDADHSAGSGGDSVACASRQSSPSESTELDIRAGDDNISWGSRRSQASAPAEDLWRSMISEDDLPDPPLIESEQVSTPRTYSSRPSSPLAARQRRAVSPYDRSFQSPGSWPRLDESPHRSQLQHRPSPRSTMDDSQQSTMDHLDHILGSQIESHSEPLTDNKRLALAQPENESDPVHASSQSPDEISDDLMESKVFSHEDAQSMYMSAMTSATHMDIPGGWTSDVQSDRSSSPEATGNTVTNAMAGLDGNSSLSERVFDDNIPAEHGTPRAQTPEQPPASALKKEVRELLFVDSAYISIPSTKPPSGAGLPTMPTDNSKATGTGEGMPGTFSAYSEMSSSRMRTSPGHVSTHSALWAPAESSGSSIKESVIEIGLGTVRAQLDISTGRILYALSTRLSSLAPASPKGADAEASPTSKPMPDQPVSAHFEHLELSLLEHISPTTGLSGPVAAADAILTICVEDCHFMHKTETSLRLGSLDVLLGGNDLFSLEHDATDLSTSQMLQPDSPVLALDISTKRFAVNQRLVTDVSIQTEQLKLSLDLAFVDETFGSFGGLSGMLEVGNSMLSESGESSPVMTPSKGVRFAGEFEPVNTEPEVKINARVGGIVARFQGPPCSIALRTSSLKAVYREQGAIATVERVVLSGPHFRNEQTPRPASVNLGTIRVEYLLTPQDKDLERLLSLLTPSKDKYDTDDDILIDTLLRQRRKGSLLRAAVGNVVVGVDDWDCISTLAALGDDLSKLSAVTKYLPEDERPGVLSLLRIKDAEFRLPVNEKFGKLRLACQDLHLAQVGLPSLLAFSIGNLHASQADTKVSLIHPVLPLTGSDSLPVIMARMLGDEELPTIKLKLFNICAEYSVPILTALAGLEDDAQPDEAVNVMVQSLSGLSMRETPADLYRGPESELSKSAAKRFMLDLLVHDCAIGLTPENLASKALVVLSDTHIGVKLPPEDSMTAKLDFRKASLFLTDHVDETLADEILPSSTSTTHRVLTYMTRQGYVSFGSIMSASVEFIIRHVSELGMNTVEVEVRDELFLLELCADSMKTLTDTLGSLAPPTKPSQEPKYLTQPTTIEDVINSFYGEEVSEPNPPAPPSVIFDVEEEPEELTSDLPLDSSLDESMFEAEADQILNESVMTDNLYGPVSGIFGDGGDEDNQSTLSDDYPETAESLLEDDPFEMTIAPEEYVGDAALMRDVGRQCNTQSENPLAGSSSYQIEDLGYDAFGAGQQALGSEHRFTVLTIDAQQQPGNRQPTRMPLRLRLRDVHIIFHMYDGYDWQHTRNQLQETVERIEHRAEERRALHRQSLNDHDDDQSVIGDFLFNSIYVGVPTSHDVQDLRRQINRHIDQDVSETASVPASGTSRPTTYSSSGQPRPRQRARRRLKLSRSKNHKIAFEITGLSTDIAVFPPGGGEDLMSVDVRVKEFEIFDNVPTSTWRKFLTHNANGTGGRERSKPMFHIQLDNVKTLESHAASEFRLHVSVLPLRLHVDQDALDFIQRFFAFKDDSVAPVEQPDNEKPFIQRIEVETVDLCLDYKPKNLDYAGLRSGDTTELMNIITLEGANIRLRHLIHYGIRGFDKLHPVLNGLWMDDVKRTQLPTILAGLAPARSLVNIASGVRDVIAIPVREYKKDGRLVRSIQKGAYQFGKTTTSELARLGAKVALGTQTLLSNAEDFLSPSDDRPSSSRRHINRRISAEGWNDADQGSDAEEGERRPAVSAYSNQPLGLLSGLKSARRYLEHDLLTARDALIAVQGGFMDSRGPGDLAGAVARHAPTVLLRPMIGATRAVGTTLLGVSNQIDRGHLKKVDDKYKRR